MEALAWLLLTSILADWMEAVRTRDFTLKDIVLLHPSTTPHPGSFKCFTCQDAADNYECNRWAPDVYCPQDTRYCYTLHLMDRHGDSVSVTKRCVAFDQCQLSGCTRVSDSGEQICSSCCEGNICNLLVPRNRSSAVFSSTSPLMSAGAKPRPSLLGCTAAAIIIAITAITATFSSSSIFSVGAV